MNRSHFSNKSQKLNSSGLKRPLDEELNLRLKDTYVSPAIGLKYSHEKLLDRYNKEILGSKQERYREILEKIQEKAKPMDHELLNKHEMEYVSNRMREREVRHNEIRQRVLSAHAGLRVQPRRLPASQVEGLHPSCGVRRVPEPQAREAGEGEASY